MCNGCFPSLRDKGKKSSDELVYSQNRIKYPSPPILKYVKIENLVFDLVTDSNFKISIKRLGVHFQSRKHIFLVRVK